jgi:hypothetical protein
VGKHEDRISSIIRRHMIRKDFVEFTDVEKNFECRLLVPAGMQLMDAFNCALRMVQALGTAANEAKERAEKEELKEEKDDRKDEAPKS